MYVYKITNLINNKIYIGITNNPKKRWGNHCCNNDPSMAIAQAIKKYGKENFKFEILFSSLTTEEAEKTEIELIQKLNSLVPNGYNIAKGGNHGSGVSLKGVNNGRALLTEDEVIYIRQHRNQPEMVLYEEFSEKISYEAFKKVYHKQTYQNIKCDEAPIYPYNFEFNCQFAGGNLNYDEIIELREAYNNHIYWKEKYEKYKDKFENEWSFWNLYNGKSYKLVMPEVFTKENKKIHASLARTGSNNGRAKLNENDVKTIRQLWANGSTRNELYQLYPQVTPTSIRDIINYKTWKQITL